MSTDLEQAHTGAPELTELGKRIEMLRIERGLSKQHLARDVGASRQQLWRVMTGKSELTSSLRQRIAEALRIDAAILTSSPVASPWTSATRTAATSALRDGIPTPTRSLASFASMVAAPSGSIEEFLGDLSRIEGALRALPFGDDGRRLKRTLLNALEDLAIERGFPLDARFFELRRRVLHHEL